MCEQWGPENTKRRASKIHVNADMSHGSAAHASDVDSSDARLGDAVWTYENSIMSCKTK